MNTPICDFVNQYAQSKALRLHMPGHKGTPLLGPEMLDITEISGADSLYEAGGIIAQSEENASCVFGCRTFYSAEGSSLAIRAMLYLVLLQSKAQGKKPLIAAARNVHKTFLSAVALLDMEVSWLYPKAGSSYLSCCLDAGEVEHFLLETPEKPIALYVTSPDYLGQITDIAALAQVCHRHGVLLAVDNAHGAYLRFLPESLHPMDQGADICCDSAHKTLPVLTGGAYLHISHRAPDLFRQQAKNALAMFGSTSPSYLILQSLDMANNVLAGEYPQKLADTAQAVEHCKKELTQAGFSLIGQEPMKITVACHSIGCTGYALAEYLQAHHIICEFADPDNLVLMVSAHTRQEEIARLCQVLLQFPRSAPVCKPAPQVHECEKVMSVRQAMLSMQETVDTDNCIGRVLASPSVGCPPAVPIAVCGERIDRQTAELFRYYGITRCCVICE